MHLLELQWLLWVIIIEEHKLIRNLGSDVPFVRKVIDKSSSFSITMVSVAAPQRVSWEVERGWRRKRRRRVCPGVSGCNAQGLWNNLLGSLAWRLIPPKVYCPVCKPLPKVIPRQGLSRIPGCWWCPARAGGGGTSGLSESQETHPKCWPVQDRGHSHLHQHLRGDVTLVTHNETWCCFTGSPKQWHLPPAAAPHKYCLAHSATVLLQWYHLIVNQRSKVFNSLTKFQCLPNSIAVIPLEKRQCNMCVLI